MEAGEFIEYLFAVLEGQKKSETHSDNVVDQLKKYIEQNLGEDLSRPVLAGKSLSFGRLCFQTFYENDGNVVAKLYRRAQN